MTRTLAGPLVFALALAPLSAQPDPAKEELKLKLPKPMFIGTPTNLRSANLEVITGKPRADDGRTVAELVRVLKDDGVFAVSVPTRLTESIYWRISRQYSRNPGGHIRIYKAKQIKQLLRDHNLEIFTTRHKHSLHSIYWLLRCIIGVNNEKALVPRMYHSLLVWDLKTRTRQVRMLDDLCNHLFPKSIVIYARKG